jgi:tetratricopeptide (TPR) repeat protein/tRNA A-37 threonylcarbamoyl transferase component Bud32
LTDTLDRLRAALSASYTLERELGQGGMATVYLAQDLKHQRRVALKVLHPDLAHALGPERFRREIEIAARLSHPHILTVFDSGNADGMLWYTMPFVEGESLRDRLERERELPLEAALQITREVADALDYAHGQQVIHRDIKPENILLSRGHALVADFGIARAMHEESGRLTSTGLSIGTPAYMSPEQADGDRSIEARSDVYSLASVSYEMLTGEPPYGGSTPRAVMLKRLTDPVPSPRRLRATIPAGMDQAIVRGLAPAPADRFASAGEFARALGDESLARPQRSRAGRRGPLIGAGGLGLVLLLAAAVLWLKPGGRPAAPSAPGLAQGDFLLSKRTPEAVDSAIRVFQAALGHSDSVTALARIGYAYTLFVDWGWPYPGLAPREVRARAMEYAERAITADSASGPAWLTRAYMLSVEDPYHMRGAVDAYARAMALDSTSAEGWYQFGQTLMSLGQDAQAAAAYRKAFALDPNRSMALMSLSAMMLREGRLAEARALIDTAVAASKVNTAYVRVARGSIALRDGDVRAAHDEADIALGLDSNYTVPARSLLTRVYVAEGHREKAAAEAARLLQESGKDDLSPTHARYVASALLAVGRPQDAIGILERARPRGAQLWFYMRSLEFEPLMSDARFVRLFQEADPRPRP